jgi:hypothetical protein
MCTYVPWYHAIRVRYAVRVRTNNITMNGISKATRNTSTHSGATGKLVRTMGLRKGNTRTYCTYHGTYRLADQCNGTISDTYTSEWFSF